jgi:hypothetical protein
MLDASPTISMHLDTSSSFHPQVFWSHQQPKFGEGEPAASHGKS